MDTSRYRMFVLRVEMTWQNFVLWMSMFDCWTQKSILEVYCRSRNPKDVGGRPVKYHGEYMYVLRDQIQDRRIPTIRFRHVRTASRTRRNFQRKWERRGKRWKRRREERFAGLPGDLPRAKGHVIFHLSCYPRGELLRIIPWKKPARINGNFPFKMRNGRAEPAVDIIREDGTAAHRPLFEDPLPLSLANSSRFWKTSCLLFLLLLYLARTYTPRLFPSRKNSFRMTVTAIIVSCANFNVKMPSLS